MSIPKDIEEIRDRRRKIDGAPWSYLQNCQWVMGKSLGGCNKTMGEYRVADIRGWGHLQYMGVERGDKVAQDMQDANGIFIANAPADIDFLLEVIEAMERHLVAPCPACPTNQPST